MSRGLRPDRLPVSTIARTILTVYTLLYIHSIAVAEKADWDEAKLRGSGGWRAERDGRKASVGWEGGYPGSDHRDSNMPPQRKSAWRIAYPPVWISIWNASCWLGCCFLSGEWAASFSRPCFLIRRSCVTSGSERFAVLPGSERQQPGHV